METPTARSSFPTKHTHSFALLVPTRQAPLPLPSSLFTPSTVVMTPSTVPPDPNPLDHHPNHSHQPSAQSNPPQCRRIQVSREKRPLNFFVTLSKKFLQTDEVIELSGLGLAVTTVVTIAEILRSSGFVYLEDIQTSLVEPHPDGHSYAPKAKIQIWIRRTPEFETLMANVNNNSTRTGAPSTQLAGEAGDTNPPAASSTAAQPHASVPSQPPADKS